MSKILSKISGPLLLGSILALGAMAWPGHASAEARFYFRGNAGLLPIQVAAVPEDEDGTAGDDQEPRGEAFMRFNYSQGWVLECRTDWTAAQLDEYRGLLETRPEVTYDMGMQVFAGVASASSSAWFYGDATFPQWLAFEAQNSLFAYEYYEDDGRVEMRTAQPMDGDPRDYPSEEAGPCSSGSAVMAEVGPSPRETGQMFYPVEIEGIELVYR